VKGTYESLLATRLAH